MLVGVYVDVARVNTQDVPDDFAVGSLEHFLRDQGVWTKAATSSVARPVMNPTLAGALATVRRSRFPGDRRRIRRIVARTTNVAIGSHHS